MPLLGTSVQVTHKFVSGKADGADGTLVQPSKWNQAENFGAGSDGQALVRDSAAAEGASWVDAAVGYQLRGLVGNNNATTPNTKFDFSANLVVLRHASLVHGVAFTNTGTLTNDTGVAGPAANGRDQAGAFSTAIWLHFYFIWGPGQTLATLSSTVAPPTGPTLPTNYTHWAYAGAVRYNAGPVLLKTRWRGSRASFEANQQVLNAGAAVVETAVSLTVVIPPNALTALITTSANSLVGTTAAAAGATVDASFSIRLVTGVDHFQYRLVGTAAAAVACTWTWPFAIEIPNMSQSFIYIWAVTTGTVAATLACTGYTMPNGGE